MQVVLKGVLTQDKHVDHDLKVFDSWLWNALKGQGLPVTDTRSSDKDTGLTSYYLYNFISDQDILYARFLTHIVEKKTTTSITS